MIPKVIHYCWFGRNELPDLAKKCIESWKKYYPDYEIKEWNEDNFDINSCTYAKEAYEQKKWAFVSDYARYKIIYENGGIYFDTDVEIIASLEDILCKGNFMACEYGKNKAEIKINPGLGIAAPSGLSIYKEIIEFYEHQNFKKMDGSNNLTTIVEYTTEVFKKYGFVSEEKIQVVKDIYIYPPEYFCPLDFYTCKLELTNNTRTIHHYSSSWMEELKTVNLKKKIKKFIGPKLTNYTIRLLEEIRKRL